MSNINRKGYVVEAAEIYETTLSYGATMFSGVIKQETENAFILDIKTANGNSIIISVDKNLVIFERNKAFELLQDALKEKPVSKEKLIEPITEEELAEI